MDEFLIDVYEIFYQILAKCAPDYVSDYYFQMILFAVSAVFTLICGILVCWTGCKFAQCTYNRFLRWGFDK